MKKIIFWGVFTLFCAFSSIMNAQVSVYSFSQTSGTYAPITGGTVVAAATATSGNGAIDDVNFSAQPIPFTFLFNGTGYTEFNINSNGYITFGATLPAAGSPYTPISNTAAYSGAISGIGRDLWGAFRTNAGGRTSGSPVLTGVVDFTGIEVGQFITGTGIPGGTTAPTTTIVSFDEGAGTITMSANATSNTTSAFAITTNSGEIRTETLGAIGSRIHVIQFKNFARFGGHNEELNFQFRLYETSNNIEIVYGSNFTLNTTSAAPQVGLRGLTNTDFNNRTSTTDWAATTSGVANTETITLSDSVFPPSGLTFEWIYPNFPPSIAYTPLLDTNTTGNRTLSVDINDTDGIATGANAPRIYWRVNAGSWQSSATTDTSNPYNFTIGTTGLAQGDVVEYYVVAQDLLGAVGANPLAGFDAVDVNNIVSPPTTPESYQVLYDPLVGGTTYLINGTDNFPSTFQNITSAVNFLITYGITGSGEVIMELAPGYASSEPAPVNIPEIPGSSSTLGVTFRPAAGYTALTEIVGAASPDRYAIQLTGCSYVTLDGRSGGTGSGRDWKVSVTGTTNAETAVRVNNASGSMTDITVRNLVMEAAAGNATNAVFHTMGSTSNTMVNLVVEDNMITSPATVTTDTRGWGISIATTNIGSTGMVIRNNDITNFYARGISITSPNPGMLIHNNRFYHTGPITQPSTIEFSAIYFSSTSVNGAGTEIFNNKVYDIQLTNHSTGTTVGINGIYLLSAPASGDPVRVYNNSIVLGPNLTGTAANMQVYGIRENTSSTGNPVLDIFYNSVYIGGELVTGSNNSAAFRKQLSSNVNLSNNIFFNARTNNGGGGTHWGIMSHNTSYSSLSNNDYFANGIGGVLGTIDGTATGNQITIVDWRAAVGADPGSVSVNPNYLNPTVSPPDLNINTATASPLESGAIVITGIISDIDGTPRYPNVGYPENPLYPPNNPDMGAYEFAGQPSDISPPAMVYVPLSNTGSLGNRTLEVNITDPSGVETGANGPRLYYKKTTDGIWQFDATPSVSGDDYTFTIDVSLLGGGGVNPGDEIEYYVASQDLVGNAGTNPGGGAGASPPGTTAPPTPNTYQVLPTLNGTYTVGTGDTYANLTEAVNALNNAVVTGNVFFELTNNYDGTSGETFPLILGEFQSDGNFTVTFRPALGVTNRVTSGDPGSGTTNPLIHFNEGDNYIFDGRPGGVGDSKEWIVRNTRSTTTYSSVFRFINDATYNTVRNLIIEGRGTATTSSVINFTTSASGEMGNSFNTIMNNDIRDRSDEVGIPLYGVYSSGTLANPNSGNMIIGNNIFNFSNTGVVVTGTGNGDDWVISDNNIYNNVTPTPTTAQTGITLSAANATNTLVSGNFIGGSGPGATGMWTNSGASVILTGISITSGIATITNNTISNISGTGTGTGARTRGINFTSDNDGIVISDNIISNLSTMSTGTGLAGGSQPIVGIHVSPGSTWFVSQITGNTIFNLTAENTGALTTSQVATGVTLTNWEGIFANNRIYDIKNKSTGTTSGQPPVAAGVFIRFINSTSVLVNNTISLGSGENTNTQFNGIMVVAGTTNQNHYYYNSIAIAGTSSGSWGSFGVLRGDNTAVSPGSPIHMYNNAVANTRSGGGSLNFAVGSQGSNATMNLNSNYNVFYSSDANTIGLLDGTSYTFDGWKLATSGDAESIPSDPLFFSATDLTPKFGSPVIGAGTPMPSVTDKDILGEDRDPVAPSIGAYENGVFVGFVYQGGMWSPNDPMDTMNPAGPADDVMVVDGIATFGGNIEINNLYINPSAILYIEGVLTLNGDIDNNGLMIFVNDLTTIGQLDTFTGNITGSGLVTVQRYIPGPGPARRAFRLLSSAVNTPSSIHANWQEGATSATHNPSSGFGTHITGSTTGADGFDATPSGNPSIFKLDHQAQNWVRLLNTDATNLSAGDAIRLLVRGDRSIDVTNNAAPPTETTLRATGTLHIGTFETPNFNASAMGQYIFFGNPYQAIVDMNSVIGASTNINPAHYYVWDPTMATRGAYVTVDLSTGNSGTSSQANQYLQPGQAAFVSTLGSGSTSLTFQELHKSVNESPSAVFSIISKLDIRLYEATAFANNDRASDGLRLKFEPEGNNAITSQDALKMYNLDENLATTHNGKLYSIESRALPQVGESIALFTNQYRSTGYIFEAHLKEVDGVTAYLRDNHTGVETELTNNAVTLYPFTVDPSNAGSISENRFEIIFKETSLGINDETFGSGFVLFPNPARENVFFIATNGLEGQNVSVRMHNILGQQVLLDSQKVNSNGRLQINTPGFPAGVYMVTLTSENGNSFTAKLINK